ncbi:hypothetical protein RMCBS344292_18699 [Rhizopus microsporus]|nr:hypothetical protein RMCBS344292_18699 [Rhizopus microsporus]
MEETGRDEKERQEKNKKDLGEIQDKAHTSKDAQEENTEAEKAQQKPGTFLDASGQAHPNTEKPPEHEEKQVFPEQHDPNAKVWSNPEDSNEENAPWKPNVHPSDGNTDNHIQKNAMDNRQLYREPSIVESTVSDIKTIFDTDDTEYRRASPKQKLKHATPLHPTQPDVLIEQLQIKALKYIIIACFICYVVGRFKYGIFFGFTIIGLCAWAYWNLGRTSSDGLEWQLEKQENMKTLYTSEGETVEWLNYMVEKIWRSIDPELFTIVEDLLEDAIQSVAPSIIKGVKVSDFDIGMQAPRIQMIRVFPPLPGQPEESIFGEASFSFHAHPVASLATNRSPKSTPPGLTLRFLTAVGAPIEVKAELTSLSGKIRFKLLTGPEIPFISKATIAFTSVPKVETGVMPLTKHLNIMNLPTIKALVNEGLKFGLADMVDPKSLTIDIRALVGAFARDTNAIGVVKVEVRQASRDPSIHLQDLKDSYATLSLSTQPKKSISSTRVLTNDIDPRWNENLYVLVYADDIVSETQVDIKVWDADKIKYDDMWGSVSMSVKDIVQGKLDKLGNVASWSQDERVVFDGWTPIDGKPIEESKVRLDMKLSFHPKYATPSTDILSKKLPQDNTSKDEKDEEQVQPEHSNGILSVTIHQASDLEIADPAILPSDDRFKHPYNPNSIVSPYAILYINDNKVFRTRTKLRNPSPHWNAITEHFVRDIDNAFIRITVKTALEFERDPVLGTKVISLSDLFTDQEAKFKEAQKWIPISDGIGFGKVLLSLKYKPVKMTLPRSLQGADVGTLVVEKLTLDRLNSPLDSTAASPTKATLAVNVDPAIIKRLKSRDIQVVDNLSGWYDRHFYFPLMMRYRTALYIHISQGALTNTKATGRVWLKDIVDNEWQDMVVGLHCHISEKTSDANKNEDAWPEEGDLGQVRLRVKFVPGFSPVHTHLRSFVKDMVGADPFYSDTLKYKAQKWIREQSKDEGNEPLDHDFQQALQEEKEKMKDEERRGSSEASSEYGEEESDDEFDEDENGADIDDTELKADMIEQRKMNKVSKHRVIRKLAWSVDKVKHKVDVLREGFNSETRAKRSVAKEI